MKNDETLLTSFALKRKIHKTLLLLGLKYDPEERSYFPTEDFLLENNIDTNILDDVCVNGEDGECFVVTINTFGGISEATSDSYTVRSEEDLTKIKGFIEATLQGFEPPVME